ncbi:MAG: DUF3040 domain-containing protein [Actinomycetales bacterium]|nr:DUF3040 domain-containing protein [Candidatus Phosphoribacter baldrii]MBK7610395.1 DUF3040 domain-containing protein [Candidatus Phosphoribacter baldrii]HRC13288.1 DUF3040 domain-containing protein [Dermatophilaceae bacterium]
MALSEREQKLLEQMEQALYAEDPRFATRIRTHGDGSSKRRMLIGIIAVLAGLGVVFLGVLGQQIWLGAIGFAVMVAGGVWAFAPARKSGPVGVVQGDGSTAARSAKAPKSGQGFMNKIEERWERRERDQW